MAMNISFFILLITIFISAFFSSALPNDANWWCEKTPNPEPCKHFMSNKSHKFGHIMGKSDFRKAALELAMERALNAESHTKWLGQKCRNKRERAAWADCLKLYESTILQLNQTLDPTTKCTTFDAQTWLSTALTNLETCRAGFVEVNASDYMLPLMNNNVTKLISNTLAINNGSGTPVESYKDGFPKWFGPGDRKLLQTSAPRANIVVAQDGSGNYRTIKAAIDAAAKRSGSGRFVIYIKRGVYRENIEIGNKMKNIMLVGDGMKYTIITGSRSIGGGSTTFDSATVIVIGSGFIARGITFRNTAGPQNHQAVALRSGSDLSVFYRCGFEGYQDTLYVHSQRQFYKECYIYGTVDFIFGNAAVVFQNCMIYGRRPMTSQKITITAQGRTDSNQNTGISIQNSRIMAASDLKPVLGSFKTFLGRPWKQYSRTVFLKNYMDSLVDPAGWLEWDGNFALNTLYYGEYMNTGPGSSTSRRVKWRGYRVITSSNEASRFTVANFIAAQSWLPNTGVPFLVGL
ncbi:putative pectinesterase [Helianthus annuus]|uniref:Pectinesterase n=2 Tax=Helianthus annuus TaxID=4232 RepID=A0A9K3IPZ0_HELAN|nr:pectinesterase 2 [Helianthus annuus]KAF5800416.1 putative pectinesterase [Helianthus annuus]